MKMKFKFNRFGRSGYALVMVLVITLASVVIMTGTLRRTYNVSTLNDRSNQLIRAQNAAEAAVEKVFALIQYDFQFNGGPGNVAASLDTYRGMIPTATESSYWTNFTFSDGAGNDNSTCVYRCGTYAGTLPKAYPGRSTTNAPMYRIVSNARWNGSTVVGTAQEDVLLALVPLTTYAIFYNSLLEFSTCATMNVRGPVHCNTNIYVGAGSSSTLTFFGSVSTVGKISAPTNNGSSWGNPTNISSSWNTTFNGTNRVGVPSIQLSINMTNTLALLQQPITNDASSIFGQQRLYNQAQVLVLVSNITLTVGTNTSSTNITVTTIIQSAPNSASVPGADPSPYVNIYTNPTTGWLKTNLEFLSITNKFNDKREKTTNYVTQIDVGSYGHWISTNTQIMAGSGKYSGAGSYPTILFVADNRLTNNNQMTSVRLTNGIAPPMNGGQGFTVVTPNPLYVWGSYNCSNTAYLGTTNTAYTVPCALMSDSLTLLSTNWSDSNSFSAYNASSSKWDASASKTNTINAAILTGIVPTTAPDRDHFSGGVHNITRLLEDWSSTTLCLNTCIVNLFNSAVAKGIFVNPGTYYQPPTRNFNYDINFSNPNRVPPGMPCALVALRLAWAAPPPGSTNYSVIP
jgi:hypothetical protein